VLWRIADAGDSKRLTVAALIERLFYCRRTRCSVKELIGKGTGTGKVISRGLLPPDDPVFKEGWSVMMWPGSWRQSPEPSGGIPNDSENTTREDEQPERGAK
jgi:hypothetical protein